MRELRASHQKGGCGAFSKVAGGSFLAGELPPEPRLPPVPAEESLRDRCTGASGFDVAVAGDLRNASRRFRADSPKAICRLRGGSGQHVLGRGRK
jgi:hypothetical protein